MLNPEVARRKRSLETVLNRGGFHNLVDVGQRDDAGIVFGRFPRSRVDLSYHFLLNVLDTFVKVVPKQVVQQGSRQFDAFVDITVAIVSRPISQSTTDEGVGHVSEHIPFLFLRWAIRKEVICQDIHRKLHLLFVAFLLFHVQRRIDHGIGNVENTVIVLDIFTCL